MICNIVIVGVGGQGVITLARILGEAAVKSACSVLASEVHGMAQRGGSVVVHVRIGFKEQVHAPLVGKGQANIMVCLEALEALRNIFYANEKTILIINERIIRPGIPVNKIPSLVEVLEALKSCKLTYHTLKAEDIAKEIGIPFAANTIMLGALMGLETLPLSKEAVEEAIATILPKKYVEKNLEAFERGWKIIKQMSSQ